LTLLLISTCLLAPASPPQTEEQIRALRAVLQEAGEAYFNRHESLISAAAYDALHRQYELLTDDRSSHSGPVGAPPGMSDRRAVHETPVLSLQKVYSDEGVTRFIEKAGTELLYCVEPKIDGLTVVLHYRNGLLAQALTRGDGKTGVEITSHTDALTMLANSGLPVIESVTVPSGGVLAAIEALERHRADLPFCTDGIVIKVDDLAVRTRMGATARHPRSAIARKVEETPVQTRLLDVEWSRAESGKLTPVARFEPVEIQGAEIQRATLHNIDYIRAMDLKIGDWINVIRAGGIIPEITGVCPERRTGTETEISIPMKHDQ